MTGVFPNEAATRDSDLLGRLGGDQFGVLLRRVHSRVEIEEVVHRLERAFQDPFDAEGHIVQGSASFGFAFYPEDGTSKGELLSTADAAMYVAKQAKRKLQGDLSCLTERQPDRAHTP